MSTVYGSTEKLYPLLPSAPQHDDESHIYRLKKIEEVEVFLRAEISEREKLYKKFKRHATTTQILDHTLITATVITGSGSIVTLCTGVGLPASIALASVSLILSLTTAITRKTNKLYDTKAKKHDKITVLAQTKLDSVHDTVSKAINDGHISPEEFQRVIHEKQRYLLLKQGIRAKTKRVTDTINDDQRRAILDRGRKEGKEDFLRQIANTSNTPDVNVI